MFSVFKGFSAFLYFAVRLHMHVPWHMSEGQRTTFRSWYFPSTMRVPGTKSRSARLSAAGAPTRGAISRALFSSFQSILPKASKTKKKVFFAASVLSVVNPQLPPGYLLLPRQSFERVLSGLNGNPFLKAVILYGA